MADFLQDFATEHFAFAPRESLFTAILNRWEPATLLQALGSDRPQLQRIAGQKLRSLLHTPDFGAAVLAGLESTDEIRVGVLTALSFLPLPAEPAMRVAVEENLWHDSPRVREAAIRVIVFQWPERVFRTLPLLEREGAGEIARLLCLSDQPELIWPLLRFYGHPVRSPPPIIGMLVNARWLAGNYHDDPDAVGWLIRECGYSDGAVTKGTLELLQRGFMYVSAEMSAHPHPDEWRLRVLEICWSLLPESLGMATTGWVNLDNTLDTALFLAAVREADRSNLDELKSRDPFSYRAMESLQILVCSHAHTPYVRRQFLDKPLALAQELSVPPDQQGRFIVEHAGVLLQTDDESRTEAELFLRAKWSVADPGPIQFPVRSDDDFPAAKRAVLREFDDPSADDRFSPGTNSICALAAYLGMDSVADWLRRGEADASRFLPPIGCELQVPLVDRNRSLAWKQALRSFGIPSPRRPEYRAMVEAAFRPAASYHAMVLGPLLLRRLGLIDRAQDIALHVSIQGDLGDHVRYLAFPQLLMRPSRRLRDRPEWTLTRVMSKGLVNCNRDVETCRDDLPAECRTEIRVFRCFADDTPDGVGVRMDYIDDMIQTHLLAAALLSEDLACASIIAAYVQELKAWVATLPAVFGDLLHANFYEATGDPRDAALLDMLPIMRIRRDVKHVIRERGMQTEVEQTLLQIRTRFAREVELSLRSRLPRGEQSSALMWTESGCRPQLPDGFCIDGCSDYFVSMPVQNRLRCR
jgi:hypothetical protein